MTEFFGDATQRTYLAACTSITLDNLDRNAVPLVAKLGKSVFTVANRVRPDNQI